MQEIKSIEVDLWSEPDEERRVTHIGMRTAGEVYQELKEHLEKKGLLPEEYFLKDFSLKDHTPLPDYDFAECTPNFGNSEGVYLDIMLFYREDDKPCRLEFATGKTLEEGADAFDKMARIAAECSLMLNGRGRVYCRRNKTLVLDEGMAEHLKALLGRDVQSAEGEAVRMDREIMKMLS